MLLVVLGCAWSFWLFHVDFGSIGQLGCFGLFQVVFCQFYFALSCVTLFKSTFCPSDCFKLFQIVFECFTWFSIVTFV